MLFKHSIFSCPFWVNRESVCGAFYFFVVFIWFQKEFTIFDGAENNWANFLISSTRVFRVSSFWNCWMHLKWFSAWLNFLKIGKMLCEEKKWFRYFIVYLQYRHRHKRHEFNLIKSFLPLCVCICVVQIL